MWKTASASPPSGGRPRLVARDHTHKRTLHKDRKGGDLFFFTHLTGESCPFLFIYLTRAQTSTRIEVTWTTKNWLGPASRSSVSQSFFTHGHRRADCVNHRRLARAIRFLLAFPGTPSCVTVSVRFRARGCAFM